MELPSTLSSPNPQNSPLKNFLYFFLKNLPCKSFPYFLKKNFSNFQDTELAYISEKVYSQPGILRTRSIFKTLVYSEPEAYSEHYQTSTMERFAKISNKHTFQSLPSQLSFISGNRTFLYFQKWSFLAYFRNFPSRKYKKTHL